MAAASNVSCSYKALPGTRVELLPALSPDLAPTLKLAIDPEALAVIQPILPYSVVVRNDSGNHLLMVAVIIAKKDAKGKIIPHNVVFGTVNNDPVDMIAPGQMVLLTPEPGLITVFPQPSPLRIPEPKLLAEQLVEVVDEYSRLASVEISLDSVVFGDGGLVGPDTLNTLTEVNAQAAAEDSVIRDSLLLHGDDLTKYLESARDSYNFDATLGDVPGFRDPEFVALRQSFADDLLRQRPAFGSEEEYLKYLQCKAELRIPILWRRTAF